MCKQNILAYSIKKILNIENKDYIVVLCFSLELTFNLLPNIQLVSNKSVSNNHDPHSMKNTLLDLRYKVMPLQKTLGYNYNKTSN